MKKYLKKIETQNLFMQIFIIGGVFGFLYEEIFYWFDLGIWTKRGITYGPEIPIYAFGSIFITLMVISKKEKPIQVFLIGTIVSGVLEFLTGYVLFHVFHTRLWNYNVEILNFGNIGGYICLRSVLFFGISSLLLLYGIIPGLNILNKKIQSIWNRRITIFLFLALHLCNLLLLLLLHHQVQLLLCKFFLHHLEHLLILILHVL